MILLVSAIVPTALLARRVIDVPALRVLAVALGTVVPWLMIGSHLLTENLAFPLYMWAVYGIVRCAEEPSLARQVGTLGVIAALTLVRLNLGFVSPSSLSRSSSPRQCGGVTNATCRSASGSAAS